MDFIIGSGLDELFFFFHLLRISVYEDGRVANACVMVDPVF